MPIRTPVAAAVRFFAAGLVCTSFCWPFQTAAAFDFGAASVVVAPADAAPEVKAKADLVASGAGDEAVLAQSLRMGPRRRVNIDASPVDQREVEAYGRFRVVWLPGTYMLDGPLVIPDAADGVIEAEGAVLEYRPPVGDAVVITGGNRNRYRFGTIVSGSDGAALAIAPTAAMPFLMSEVSFTGLVGRKGVGAGLRIDPTAENVTTSRIQGTDVAGFDTCVDVRPPSPPPDAPPGFGKMDTNHFWLSYLRRCRIGVSVDGARGGVDSNDWNVNVDASLPGSVAIRTSGRYDRWRVIMGVWAPDGTALELAPGARSNVFDVTPPLDQFAFRDDSGNDTNVMISARSLATLPPPQALPPPPRDVALVKPNVGPQGDYNLLRIDGRFFAVHQSLGAVDFHQEMLGDRDLPPWIFRGMDETALRARLVASGEDPAAFSFRRRGRAIVALRAPLPADLIGAERFGVRSLPPLAAAGMSEAAVEELLAAFAAAPPASR